MLGMIEKSTRNGLIITESPNRFSARNPAQNPPVSSLLTLVPSIHKSLISSDAARHAIQVHPANTRMVADQNQRLFQIAGQSEDAERAVLR